LTSINVSTNELTL